jgi:chromosome segregation ATPase
VHQDNLYNWLSAVSKLFYKCHLGKMEKSKQKTLLTAEVKRHLATVKEAQKSKEIPKPLPECNLSTLVDIPWVIRNERVSTACRKESNYTYVTGEDTLITIREPQARVQPEKKKRTKKRKSLSAGEAESEAASVSASLQPSEDLLRDQDHKIHVLERSKKRLKKEFRGMLTKVEELREQNEALSAELSSNGLSRKSIASKQTRFSTINSKDQDHEEELKAAKREIKELKLALKAAKERPEENEELEAAKRQIEELKQELKAAKERPAAAKTESEDEDELDAKAQIEELKRALKAAEERAEVAETETEIQQEIANELRKKSAELRRAAKHASP